MASKTALVVFLALVALQGTSGGTIIDMFINPVREQINVAMNTTKVFEGRIEEVSQGFVEKLKGVVQKMCAEFNSTVEKAKAAGVDVQECVRNNSAALNKTSENLIAAKLKCLVEARGAAQQDIDGVRNAAGEGNATIAKALQDISKCSNIFCSLSVKMKAEAELAAIAVKLAGRVPALLSKQAEVLATLAACEGGAMRTAQGDAQTAFGGGAKCIQDKINGTRQQ